MNTDFIITDIFRVTFVDMYEYPDKHLTFSNLMECNELVFHISGKSKLLYNNNEFYIQPNTLRFLPKGANSRYEVLREEVGDCILVDFLTNKPISEDAFTVFNKYTGRFYPLFNKMFSVWVAKNEGYKFECISILYKIFAEMQKTKYIPDGQFKAIKPAIDYIEAHFLEGKIAAEDISQNCDFSYEYIRKLFVKKFGVSPIKYAINLKINYACELMQSGIYTVSQIAEMCGYNDIYFFSRQFKEYMGITPTEFINKYKSSK